jgi:hypothetical protein
MRSAQSCRPTHKLLLAALPSHNVRSDAVSALPCPAPPYAADTILEALPALVHDKRRTKPRYTKSVAKNAATGAPNGYGHIVQQIRRLSGFSKQPQRFNTFTKYAPGAVMRPRFGCRDKHPSAVSL